LLPFLVENHPGLFGARALPKSPAAGRAARGRHGFWSGLEPKGLEEETAVHSTASKALCGLMSWVLLFTWCALPLAEVPAPEPSPREPGARDLLDLADKMELWLDDVKSAADALPRETFDAAAVVEKIGRDPMRLFEWVRDNTSLVPYRGSLRGPSGVLLDRTGNSLDRSLLLCELLRLAGFETRLAHASLTAEQAAALEARSLPALAATPLPAAPEAPDEIDRVAQRYHADAAELRRLAEEASAAGRRRVEQFEARVAQQTQMLAGLLGPGTPPPSGQAASDPQRSSQAASDLEALRDHWWVQWRQDETWTDLDPSLPGAATDRRLEQAPETLAPDGLPETTFHRVALRVVVERWEDGRLVETTALSRVLRPAESYGRRMRLFFIPVDWPVELRVLAEPGAETLLRSAVLDQHEWLPVLMVGSEPFAQSSFLDTGETRSGPAGKGAAAGTGSALEGLASGVESIGEEPEAAAAVEPAPNKRLTAVWVDYEILVPGRPGRSIRRELFDLLGPAARASASVPRPEPTEAQRLTRGLTLLGAIELLPLAARWSPQFAQRRLADELLANRKTLLDLLRSQASSEPASAADLLGKLQLPPTELYALALARHGTGSAGNAYLDRPNLLCQRSHLALDAEGRLVLRRSLDIVASEVAVRPGPGVDPFRVRLEQGVRDANAEALAMQGEPSALGAAELLARSQAQGVDWVVLHSAADAALQSLGLPADARARIEQDLAAGYAALVPKKLISADGRALVSWWRLDPASGDLLGRVQSGEGGEFVEYLIVSGNIAISVLTGMLAAAGCGAFNKGSSLGKVIGCSICGFIAFVLTYIAVTTFFEAGGAALFGGVGSFVTGKGGFVGGLVIGNVCNAISWGM
jgi:hypothetical protein